jgi:hypothetical protein
MITRIDKLLARILKKVSARARAREYLFRGERAGKLRIIFDPARRLLPAGSKANATFQTKRKNENKAESIIWLFFSRQTLLTSKVMQAKLVHELVHYLDFDVDFRFSEEYIESNWNRLMSIYESGDRKLFNKEKRVGEHEDRAYGFQREWLAANL